MKAVDLRLAEHATEQHQVFSRRQARRAGLTPAALWGRLRSGSLVACGPQALHFAGVTLDYRGRLMAGLLDLGAGALVSGPAAAHLLGLDGFGEGPLEFVVPRVARNRHTIGAVHSISGPDTLDRVNLDGLACTSATLTVVELLARGTKEQAANALDSACRRRLTAVPVVAQRLDELGRQGRPGVAMFEEIIADAVVDSWLERRFLGVLRSAGLPIPSPQRRHRLNGVGVVRVDFEFDHVPIVIEVGGRQGYLSAGDRQRKRPSQLRAALWADDLLLHPQRRRRGSRLRRRDRYRCARTRPGARRNRLTVAARRRGSMAGVEAVTVDVSSVDRW
ncbi:hypothetical protein [Desertimonas flava]|uniref:hypothetical protein n=1 Tax=Desertimonas flava TaxID=2064846 RepID=UPI0013C4FB89|nr:hypothetical protein [Desertimonas flava]